MKDDGPAPPVPRSRPLRVALRGVLRRARDRVLSADAAWSAVFVVCMLGLLETRHCGSSYAVYSLGQTVPADVVAVHEVDFRDDELTDRRRREAGEHVPDVWVLDTRRGERVGAELASVFEEGRRLLALPPVPEAEAQARWDALARRAGPEAVRALRARGFSPEIERQLVEAVERVQHAPVVGNRALLERSPAILLVRTPGGGEERLRQFGGIIDLDEARRQVRAAVLASPLGRDGSDPDRDLWADLAASFADASLSFDPAQTAARREAASAAVPPVLLRLRAGTVLVRAGERITADGLGFIEAARRAALRKTGPVEVAAVASVLAMMAFFLRRYARDQDRESRRVRNVHALLVVVLVLSMALAQLVVLGARLVVDDLPAPFDDAMSWAYLVPVAGGAILVGLLSRTRVALVYAGFSSVLFGGLLGWDALRIVWAFLAQLAGVFAVSAYRGERAALLRAGLVAGGAGAAAALAVEALASGAESGSRAIFGASLALVGGAVGAPLVVSFALPLFEAMFNVVTDIRLLELSNVNHPLLSQLAVKAPGSYNHSLVVGTLAEEAAKSIGADPLFCRVAAFYHDIGKMDKPEYYVENQHGDNPHDRLAPSMSALVIAAHVKDGIRLAREAGLPDAIVDIIPQHHGTRLMTYFYEKAKRSADPALGEPSEDEFRYPGPKPRTAEAAIFMLADGVEAAARTVDEHTQDRLREVIRKVAASVVLERQLDECDLTFADLEKIQDAFLRTLLGMHHQRLEYPGFVFRRPHSERRSAERERSAGRSS